MLNLAAALAFAVLLFLKFTTHTDISWFVVVSPFFFLLAFYMVMFFVFLVIGFWVKE